MDNLVNKISELISDNIFYYVSETMLELPVNEALFSNREKKKLNKKQFEIYMLSSEALNYEGEFIKYIPFSSWNIVTMENYEETECEEIQICLETISHKKLKNLYNGTANISEIKFKDQRAARMMMLKETNDKKELEKEWSRYKYLVMEHSQKEYNDLRIVFANPIELTVDKFYQTMFNALAQTPTKGSRVNALQHVWGYFKKCASGEEKLKFEMMLQTFDGDDGSHIKDFLIVLTHKYDIQFLKNSYYFLDNGPK